MGTIGDNDGNEPKVALKRFLKYSTMMCSAPGLVDVCAKAGGVDSVDVNQLVIDKKTVESVLNLDEVLSPASIDAPLSTAMNEMFEKTHIKLSQAFQYSQNICRDKGHQLIFFVNLPLTQWFLAQCLARKGFRVGAVTPATPMYEAGNIYTAFNAGGKYDILVLLYSLSARSINLQKNCWHAIFYEPAPTPLLHSQAIGRLVRLGQTKSVQFYALIIKNTPDAWQSKFVQVKLMLPGLDVATYVLREIEVVKTELGFNNVLNAAWTDNMVNEMALRLQRKMEDYVGGV